jgi:hypothetical protein
MSYGLLTYDDAARREDLTDVLADVSPDENPLMTMLGTTTAKGTYHEWLEDYISRPSSVDSAYEGQVADFADLTQPSRRGNVTHIIQQTFQVSETESAVSVAGMGDPYTYQAAKALRTWKNKAEYNILRSTKASGSSGVARTLIGIDAVTTSHCTARNSGTSLSETEFNTMVSESWTDVGSDNVFDTVLVPFGLKQKISTFTAGNNRYIDASDKRLTRPVMVYESDGGIHKIYAHKDVRSAATTPGPTFLGIKENMWKVAYLRPLKKVDVAKTGDSKGGYYVGEFTLEYRAERTGVKRTGYNQAG